MKHIILILNLIIGQTLFGNIHINKSIDEAFMNKDSVEILQLSNIEQSLPESIFELKN